MSFGGLYDSRRTSSFTSSLALLSSQLILLVKFFSKDLLFSHSSIPYENYPKEVQVTVLGSYQSLVPCSQFYTATFA